LTLEVDCSTQIAKICVQKHPPSIHHSPKRSDTLAGQYREIADLESASVAEVHQNHNSRRQYALSLWPEHQDLRILAILNDTASYQRDAYQYRSSVFAGALEKSIPTKNRDDRSVTSLENAYLLRSRS